MIIYERPRSTLTVYRVKIHKLPSLLKLSSRSHFCHYAHDWPEQVAEPELMLVSTQSASVSGNYVLVNCEAGDDEPKWPPRERMRHRTKWYEAGKLSWSEKTLLYAYPEHLRKSRGSSDRRVPPSRENPDGVTRARIKEGEKKKR